MSDHSHALSEADPLASLPAVGSASESARAADHPTGAGHAGPRLSLVDALYERVRVACDEASALSRVELDEHARRIADTLLRKAKARSDK